VHRAARIIAGEPVAAAPPPDTTLSEAARVTPSLVADPKPLVK
jgi:hypothetical protein